MSISQSEARSAIIEYEKLLLEIKTRNMELMKLRKRTKDLEKNIISYLDLLENPAVKCGNLTVKTIEKKGRKGKSKSEKESECKEIMKKYNIKDKGFLIEITEALKGVEIEKKCIKLDK